MQHSQSNAAAPDRKEVRYFAKLEETTDSSDGSTRTVTHVVVPKTTYVILRSEVVDHGDGRSSGGTSSHGEFECADEAERIMRLIASKKDSDSAQDL